MENYHEKVEDYLLGTLTESEQAAFEDAFQKDAALAQSVAQHREMMLRLDALRLRNKVKTVLATERTETGQMFPHRTFWSMAASLLLLAAAVWFFNQPAETQPGIVGNLPQTSQPETPFEQGKTAQNETPVPKPNEPKPIKPTEKANEKSARLLALAREYHVQPNQGFVRDMQVNEPQKSPVQMAAEAYGNKNYRLALNQLRLMEIAAQDEEALFLRANSHFQLRQFADAAHDFDALKNSFQFRHEARWNFLLCQIALGKMERAKDLLAEMVAEEDFPFRTQAVELKGKLNF